MLVVNTDFETKSSIWKCKCGVNAHGKDLDSHGTEAAELTIFRYPNNMLFSGYQANSFTWLIKEEKYVEIYPTAKGV